MNRNLSVIEFSRCRNLLALPTCLLMLSVLNGTASRGGEVPAGGDVANAEMFAAMEAGQIEVKFIPINATKANVLVKNLTDKPLNIQMPAAFAGVPVLAQFGGGMGGMGGGMGGMGGGMGGMGGGMGGMGGGQAMGGGMGGMGGGMGGMGGGGMGGGGMGGMGGFQRIAPERVKKISVVTVCLEHGKPDPNPKMAYKIVPLEQFTTSPNVRMVCETLGNGMITQNTAQAVAWHLMDNMSWAELAQKNRVESKYTGTLRWFSPIELKTAMLVVHEIDRIVRTSDDYAKQSESGSSLADDAS
ncbi:hypothetical protein Pla52o_46490 [Novipirellula galeiformis]|uniref:Uncharacterized protein n=1 Tax=Novipirellula galeiformis TaxID=2528004 RepID=A0A5C6C7R7_9BACT|nr:hypothetical protein [Novipirellula galeiformis]TWU20135.1 hypothetical protein Pla52o_46490 [Novipirellula galeiformis]